MGVRYLVKSVTAKEQCARHAAAATTATLLLRDVSQCVTSSSLSLPHLPRTHPCRVCRTQTAVSTSSLDRHKQSDKKSTSNSRRTLNAADAAPIFFCCCCISFLAVCVCLASREITSRFVSRIREGSPHSVSLSFSHSNSLSPHLAADLMHLRLI